MSTLSLRRLARFGDVRKCNRVFCRYDSTTSSAVEATSPPSRPFKPSRTAAHTHFLAIPMYDGTFMGRVEELRAFMREKGPIANLDPETVIPNVRKALLYRFGRINIKGFQQYNRAAMPGQIEYSMEQVTETLEKAKNRIEAEVDKDALTLTWGAFAPVIPFFKESGFKQTFDPASVKVLHLRSKLGSALESAKKIQAIIFQELELAGIANARLRESPNVHVAIVNSRWRPANELIVPQSASFNIKTLYTIPGFDQFRTAPLPPSDGALARFTFADLGQSTMKNFVLEEVPANFSQLKEDPIITKIYEFA